MTSEATSPGQGSPSPLVERLGLRYFEALARDAGEVVPEDAIHVLNPRERAALVAVQRGVIARAALAGAVSSLASGLAEWLATPLLDAAMPTLSGTARFWALVLLVTGLASVVEIAFLYRDALRGVQRLATVAGFVVAAEAGTESERREVAAALVRAALELPNVTGPTLGVDPLRESSRLVVVLSSIAYKAKIGVTNFAAKALVRRALGRAVVRGWLPFVGVPVTAAWNAVVAWLVLREARIRAMGPSAIREQLDALLPERTPPSPSLADAALRAVACAVVRTREMHPNHARLLQGVRARVAVECEAPDDVGRLLATVDALAPSERPVALAVLVLATVVDGRVVAAERRLLRDVFARAKVALDLRAVDRARRDFVHGRGINLGAFAVAR